MSLLGKGNKCQMPYLAWECSNAQQRMTEIIKDVYNNSSGPKTREPGGKGLESISRTSCANDEGVLRADLNSSLPIHIRRTLDQFYYCNLSDTQARDEDQVVYRYTKKTMGLQDPLLVMVDQLWLWVIEESKITPVVPLQVC